MPIGKMSDGQILQYLTIFNHSVNGRPSRTSEDETSVRIPLAGEKGN